MNVDFDDNLEDMHVSLRWFTEVHGVVGGRAAVNSPVLLDMLEIHRQHSPRWRIRQRDQTIIYINNEWRVEQPGSSSVHSMSQPAVRISHNSQEPMVWRIQGHPGPSRTRGVEEPRPSKLAV